MAEDSSPVLMDSLNKCFADVKQLTVQFEDLEDKVEIVDCFYSQLDGNQEEDRRKIEKLEKRVAELEADFGKTDLLEERVAVMKVQNIELRDHLNLTIDMLNNVTTILNSQFMNKESADEAIQTEATTPHEDIKDEDTQHTLKKVYAKYEVTTPHEDMDKDTQPTLSQVYVMYQSQPPDEEGWDEMTTAIKAAEEYEARKKVNGLTANEWQDLLRLK